MWRAGRWFILIIHTASQFSAYVCCGHTAAWIKMPLGTEVGLGLRDIVLDGNPASPSLKGHSPQFLAHVYCGQTAGRMKTPLGTELDLGPGHIVLDGVPALRERGTAAPPLLFGPCLLWRQWPILLSSCYIKLEQPPHGTCDMNLISTFSILNSTISKYSQTAQF